jgi:hypothetical protein
MTGYGKEKRERESRTIRHPSRAFLIRVFRYLFNTERKRRKERADHKTGSVLFLIEVSMTSSRKRESESRPCDIFGDTSIQTTSSLS